MSGIESRYSIPRLEMSRTRALVLDILEECARRGLSVKEVRRLPSELHVEIRSIISKTEEERFTLR